MPTTFNFTPEDLANPVGSRLLSSRGKFYQRSLYKEAIYPPDTMRPLDSWYDKNLFGRVDQQQNAIIPREDKLVTLSKGASPNLYVLDFVNDAFTDFVEHMQVAYLTNCINRGGNPALFNVKGFLAYTNPWTKYKSYLSAVREGFMNNYTDSLEAPIKNFTDFKKIFVEEYLKLIVETAPLSQTGLYLSNIVSPFISGLKVGIAREDADDDSVKFQTFINDPNFTYYVQAAKKFGFIVDKNVPWILTADLFSDALLSYLDLNDEYQAITPDNFFESYYTQAYHNDMHYWNNWVRESYTVFRLNSPLYADEKIVFKKGCTGTQALQPQSFYRSPLDVQDRLTPKEIIDLYTWVRHIEAAGNGPSLKNIRQRSYELYRAGDGELTFWNTLPKFINDAYKDSIYPPNYGQGNRDLVVDKQITADILDTALDIATTISIQKLIALAITPTT